MGGWVPVGPGGYLTITNGVDRMVADLVVDRANKMWHDRANEFIKAIEIAAANGVGKAFG